MLDKNFIDSIEFDNQFVKNLPADPEKNNFRRQVEGACYSRVYPVKTAEPKRIIYSKEMAKDLGFSKEFCESDTFVQVFSGNALMPGMDPFAMCYGGHQFGNWAGQLGDGRAINLGEIITPASGRQVLQLKGAGPTPYSRNADGLAVLRSSVREFLCSEAMFHLGIPTTRALSLVLTGEQVERDMFYDGHPKLEPGAIVCRVAPSFIRFGNFEIFCSRGDLTVLKQLADYTIKTDFPHLGEPGPRVYVKWFEEICKKTCEMIIHWMRTGFVHGVMNTDNMSVLGLTIDYGPYGWLENFDPGWTPNTTDATMRRYTFGNQPQIALWNLAQLGNALYPLIQDAAPLQDTINEYHRLYQTGFNNMMAAKLGLSAFNPSTDDSLIQDLMALLAMIETDMTIFYRNLAHLDNDRLAKDILKSDADIQTFAPPLMDAYYRPEQIDTTYLQHLKNWLEQYARRIHNDSLSAEQRREKMNHTNPKYVLRNYLTQLAIEKAESGDFSMIHDLLEVMRHPYDEQPGKESFAEKRPDWARTKPGCSMLSCSS